MVNHGYIGFITWLFQLNYKLRIIEMVTHGYPWLPPCDLFFPAGSRSWVNIGAKKRDGGVLCSNPQKDRKTNGNLQYNVWRIHLLYHPRNTVLSLSRLTISKLEWKRLLYLNTQIVHLRMSNACWLTVTMVCRIMIMSIYSVDSLRS